MRRCLLAFILLCLVPAPAFAQTVRITDGTDFLSVNADGSLTVNIGTGGPVQVTQGTPATDTDTLTLAGCVRADTAAVATGVADGDRARCIVDATGKLWVNVGTVPVTQSGAWTVTANAGTGTFAISAASLPLPTGAATAANQDGIVRDGTGDTGQANVSSGRLHVDGSGVTQPVSGTVTANAGSGTFTVSGTTFDGITRDGTGDTTQANVSSGRLHVDGSGVTQPVSIGATVATDPTDEDARVLGRVKIHDGTDTAQVSATAGGSLQVECTSGCGGSGGTSIADKAAFTAGTTSLTPTGGYRDDATPSTLAEGEAGAARMTENRALHVNLRDATGAELSVGGGTQYDQGTATTATDKLTMSGAIRRDTAALDAGVADGDRAALSTDSAGRLRVTAADTTQPISAASLPLPTGAATAANQDGIVKDGAGDTTQANVSSGRLHVDGSGVTQPVSGTVTVTDGAGNLTIDGTVTANQGGAPWSVAGPAADGVAVSGNPVRIGGKDGSGNTQDIATDTSGELQIDVLSLPNEGQQTAANSISVTPDTDNDSIGATAAAPPGEATYIGGLQSGATGGLLGGITVCDTFVNINVSTATTTLLVTGVSGRHVRFCSIRVMVAGAQTAALISGTGATCGTGTTGMGGGTTAATGFLQAAAQGGLTHGSGVGEIERTNATGDSVCLVTGSAVQTSGRLGYAIH